MTAYTLGGGSDHFEHASCAQGARCERSVVLPEPACSAASLRTASQMQNADFRETREATGNSCQGATML